MFEHPGQRIQTVAQVFAMIQVIGGFIGGIIVASEAESFWLFLLVFIGAAASAVLSGLFLYGFGTLIETSEDNEKNTREILELLRRQQQKGGSVPGAVRTVPAPKAVPAAPPAPKTEAPTQKAPTQTAAPGVKGLVMPVPLENGFVKCPACGTVQRAGRNLCYNCGAPFDHSPETSAAAEQEAPTQTDAPGAIGPVVPIPQPGEREKCPVCKTIQRAGRSLCMSCGRPFLRE